MYTPRLDYAVIHEPDDSRIESVALDYTGGGIYIDAVTLKDGRIIGIGEGSTTHASIVIYCSADCYDGACADHGCTGQLV